MKNFKDLDQGTQLADKKKRFLVLVDGNPRDLLSIGILLQKLDYNIYTSNSAEEAIQVSSVIVPALIITELTLPGMNGIDFLKHIKKDPRTRSIPVIILTDMNKPKIEDLCRREGCAAYFVKPFEPDTLYRAIQNATEPVPRQYIRLKTCMTMVIGEGIDKETVSSECITALSENGMYISTLNPLPVGTTVPVSITVENQNLRLEGIVLYSYTAGHGPLKQPGMGVKFINISSDMQNLLRTYITKQLMEDFPPRS